MALTLAQGNMYSTTELSRVVTDILTKDSEILQRLQFEELLGNSLTYDLVATRSGAAFYAVNDTWVESTVVLSQDTVTLKILGGDADIDEFLLRTRSNKMDLKGTVLEDKSLAVQEKFMDTFYYGNVTTNSKEFNGLHKLINSTVYNTVHAGAGTGSDLSLMKVRQACDLVTGFKPACIVMSKAMRRGISVYLDTIGEKFGTTGRDEVGRHWETYNNLPIIVDDHITNTELASGGAWCTGTGSDTSIFILTFAPKAICGVQGSNRVEVEPLGKLETKDATRYRIKWYCGLKFENLRSCAKVDGITAAGTVVA